jgi:hypothetical protein
MVWLVQDPSLWAIDSNLQIGITFYRNLGVDCRLKTSHCNSSVPCFRNISADYLRHRPSVISSLSICGKLLEAPRYPRCQTTHPFTTLHIITGRGY